MQLKENSRWNLYESAILLEAVINAEAGKETRDKAIRTVSRKLREGAYALGNEIDDSFRSETEISAIWDVAVNAFYSGGRDAVLPKAMKTFSEAVSMCYGAPGRFKKLLNEARERYCVQNRCDGFFQWLNTELPGYDMTLIQACFDELEEFGFKKTILTHRLFWNSSVAELKLLKKASSSSKAFRLRNNGKNSRIQQALQLYIQFIEAHGTHEMQVAFPNVSVYDQVREQTGRNNSFIDWLKEKRDRTLTSKQILTAINDMSDFAAEHSMTDRLLPDLSDEKELRRIGSVILTNTAYRKKHEGEMEVSYRAFELFLQYVRENYKYTGTNSSDLKKYIEKIGNTTVPKNERIREEIKKTDIIPREEQTESEPEKSGEKSTAFFEWIIHNCPIGYTSETMIQAFKEMSVYAEANRLLKETFPELTQESEIRRAGRIVLTDRGFRETFSGSMEEMYAVFDLYLSYIKQTTQ